MLELCARDQWRAEDLDWSGTPRELPPDDERAIVQYFTDMAAIERLAKALFVEQERRATEPRLRAIFASFVEDEERHAVVAERLARYYDRRKLEDYRTHPSLDRFVPHFVAAVRLVSDEIANSYVLAGELILDVALLRSLDDYVKDSMSARAMKLINRDESRHIAVDYHMVEYYASDAFEEELRRRGPRALPARIRGALAVARMLYAGAPFFREVFFQPMARLDPSGRRLREAMKRMQLIGAKPGVARRPFGRFMKGLQDLYLHPLGRIFFGRVLARLAGVDERFLAKLYSDEEWERAKRMSFDALAEEALLAKTH